MYRVNFVYDTVPKFYASSDSSHDFPAQTKNAKVVLKFTIESRPSLLYHCTSELVIITLIFDACYCNVIWRWYLTLVIVTLSDVDIWHLLLWRCLTLIFNTCYCDVVWRWYLTLSCYCDVVWHWYLTLVIVTLSDIDIWCLLL